MEDQEQKSKQPEYNWKILFVRILIYIAVGFLCAFLYHYLKKD